MGMGRLLGILGFGPNILVLVGVVLSPSSFNFSPLCVRGLESDDFLGDFVARKSSLVVSGGVKWNLHIIIWANCPYFILLGLAALENGIPHFHSDFFTESNSAMK
nr:hypothetical protein Iba_chr09fCG2740 [Ipomoea batatas]